MASLTVKMGSRWVNGFIRSFTFQIFLLYIPKVYIGADRLTLRGRAMVFCCVQTFYFKFDL